MPFDIQTELLCLYALRAIRLVCAVMLGLWLAGYDPIEIVFRWS